MMRGSVEEEVDGDAGGAVADSWDNLADAPVAVDPVDIAHVQDEEDVTVQDDWASFECQAGCLSRLHRRVKHDCNMI